MMCRAGGRIRERRAIIRIYKQTEWRVIRPKKEEKEEEEEEEEEQVIK